MLWRRIKDYKELMEIVKLMDFIGEKRIGHYLHPFNDKKFPITMASFDDFIIELLKNEDDEGTITHLVSNWVYSNCPYNAPSGSIKTQFDKAKDVFYYYERMRKNVG